jgi:carboxylate-amine ligase
MRTPEWATWNAHPALEAWTVGIEEEVMLLEPDGAPAWRSEDVLRVLPDALARHTRGETHGLARTGAPRADVRAARARRRAGE